MFLKLVKFITQSYICLSLLNSCLFLSTFTVFLKSLNELFLQMAWLKVSISVIKLKIKLCDVPIFFCIQLFPTFLMVQVFQGPITLK